MLQIRCGKDYQVNSYEDKVSLLLLVSLTWVIVEWEMTTKACQTWRRLSHAVSDRNGSVDPWTRYYPLEHVVNIYNLTGRNVSLKDLEESKLVFDLALWAENTFGPLLVTAYSELYKHVPAVDERVVESIGGIDDMAFWASVRLVISLFLSLSLTHTNIKNRASGNESRTGLRKDHPVIHLHEDDETLTKHRIWEIL